MPNRPWSRQDERKLLQLRAAQMPWRYIAFQLKRSEASVVGRYRNKLKDQQTVAIARKPKLRLPPQDLLSRRTAQAMAENKRLRAELIESRWKAAVLESELRETYDSIFN